MNNRFSGNKPEKEVFQVFHDTMEKLINEDPSVVYLDADLMGSLKTRDLWVKYPNNVFNVGIQEANMTGVAAGMYLNGLKPYIHTFSPFASRRIFDQAFISVAYANKSVRIIGSDAGLMATHNGGTHMCFEDVAMYRTVPGACIIDVSDPTMAGAFLKLTKDRPGLTYIRMPRRDLPDIYCNDEKFEIGRGKTLKDGKDITIIACGIMVSTALRSAYEMEKEGVSVRVVDIVTIEPLDTELIEKCARETQKVLVIENASLQGGLGEAVCAYLSCHYPVPVHRMGIDGQFGKVGIESYLREEYGLNVDSVIAKIREML